MAVRYKKVLPHVSFAILVVVFVLLNNFSSKDNSKVLQLSPKNAQNPQMQEKVRVTKIVDGDTVKVLINNKEEAVRLIGIDAPETMDPRKTIECFGKEAGDKAKEILTGKTVTLESDPTQGDRDKYGRLLRYVFLDNLNFNELMVSEGYAHEYTYQSNPYKYQLKFIEAEKKASENKEGLWADNACMR